MKNSLACPNCSFEIEVTELMRAQVASQIRSELDAEVASRHKQLDKQRDQLDSQLADVYKERESLAAQVRQQVEAQRVALLAEATERAKESLAVEIADRDERLKELTGLLSTARKQELELRKQQRELQTEKESLKLDVARQLDAERQQLIHSAKLQFDQEHELKQAEKDKKIADLATKLKEMQRKVEQGSQQLQGEIQELALESMLESSFPGDEIDPVGKGVGGGDCVQSVINHSGQVCGRILWESKRTKAWGSAWLAKARDDARECRSDCVVIVSEALPDNVQGFAMVDGVWVCSWATAKSLAMALRHGLVEVRKARTASQGQHAKQELVYNYLSGSEFQRRVAGIAEAFMTMKIDLDSEKRAFKKQWSKREKQLERAITNTACLYGDLQGIIGASLPKIEGLETMLIEDQRDVEQQL